MMCWFPCRRTIHERNFGNPEGGALGGCSVPSGRSAGRNAGLFFCASSGFGGKCSFAGAGEAGAACEATHGVAELDERTEPAGGCDPAAVAHRSENDSRSVG